MEKKQRYAPELPWDVLTEILSRFPAESLLRFKCVCKSWYRLISDEDFVRSHLEYWRSAGHVQISGGLSGRKPMIYLLTLNLEDEEAQSCSDEICLDGLADALRLPELRMLVFTDEVRFIFHDSCDGLLLLEVDDWHLLVCNPVTKWYMLLPPCPSFKITDSRWFIASDDPVQRYKIVGLYCCPKSSIVRCYMFELQQGGGRGSGFWKEELEAHIPLGSVILPPSLSIGRKVHWLIMGRFEKLNEVVLLSLDLSTERLTLTETLNLPYYPGPRHWFLSNRAMCFGWRIESSKEIEVWMLEDFDRPVWRKHHVITNYPRGLGFPSEHSDLSPMLYMKEEDELIMRMYWDRFVYKMSSREWRRIITPAEDPSTSKLAYRRNYHVNSLVGCGRRRNSRTTC